MLGTFKINIAVLYFCFFLSARINSPTTAELLSNIGADSRVHTTIALFQFRLRPGGI